MHICTCSSTTLQKKDIEKRKQIAGRGGWKGGRGGKSAGEKDPEDDWDGGWDASMTPDLVSRHFSCVMCTLVHVIVACVQFLQNLYSGR